MRQRRSLRNYGVWSSRHLASLTYCDLPSRHSLGNCTLPSCLAPSQRPQTLGPAISISWSSVTRWPTVSFLRLLSRPRIAYNEQSIQRCIHGAKSTSDFARKIYSSSAWLHNPNCGSLEKLMTSPLDNLRGRRSHGGEMKSERESVCING